MIIGAGVTGAALADELASRGWDDITVVDQGDIPVTGGSTSHAPGAVFQCNSSKTMTKMATYTVQKFSQLRHEGRSCFLPIGGLEVATSAERLAELHRRHGWVTAWGVDAEILDPDQCAKLFPLLDPEVVLGGLHVATDGIAKAVDAVAAQLARAATRGARVLPRTEVLATAGMRLPQTPMGHQLARTGVLAGVQGRREEAVAPLLRHQDGDLYYREVYDTLAVGYYGHRAMPIAATDLLGVDAAAAAAPGGMPSVLAFTPEDFAPGWAETQRLLPATRAAGLASGINGVFSFTPDGMPLLGESSEVSGFWVAEAVWVTHSAGVGKAMAELLVDGTCSSFDLHGCEVHRFEEFQLEPGYVRERNCTSFDEIYDIIHPLQPLESPRGLRTSPFYPRQQQLGAFFSEASGWERPQWYEANAPLVAGRDIITPDPWAARFWSPIVGAEAQLTRERVALFDMSALKRLEISGSGATAFLQHLVTGNIDKSVGSVTYCLLLDHGGRIRSDLTVARLAPDRYQVGANGNLDVVWLRRQLPGDGSVQLRDITPGTCGLGLWGPLAREVLQPLTAQDLSNDRLKYFRATSLHIGNVPVTALRLSYVGELGWDLYTTADHGLRLWDTLWRAGQDHGIIAAGRGAFSSLRLEKGYRSFGADMGFEHDPWEAGLGFAVRLDKGDFVGRDAVVHRRSEQTRKLACLTLDDPGAVVLGKEPVLVGGDTVGYLTSAAYGYTIGRGVAYAWLPVELAEPGQSVEITYFDRPVSATVSTEPLVDPGMTRLRG